MTYDVIASDWLSTNVAGGMPVQMGIVAIRQHHSNNKWKSYIGVVFGKDEESDMQLVASQGAKLPKAVACAWFPQLNPDDWTD